MHILHIQAKYIHEKSIRLANGYVKMSQYITTRKNHIEIEENQNIDVSPS